MEILDSILGFVFTLFAGLGLILLALRFLSEAVQNLGASALQWALEVASRNRAMAFVAGVVTSFVVQSGIGAATMAISFSSSGLVALDPLILFLLGTNLGTVLTPWLFTITAGYLDVYLIALGALPMLYSRSAKFSQLGRLAFAIGLLLLAYRIVILGAGDGLDIQILATFLGERAGSGPIWLAGIVAVGVLVSWFIRSSVALMGLILLLVECQLISVYGGVGLVLGVNLGGTLPALWAARTADTNGRRGAVAHFLSQFVTLALVLVLYDAFLSWNVRCLNSWGITEGAQVAVLTVPLAHLLFNLGAVVLFTTLHPLTRKVVERWVSASRRKEPQRLKFHGHIHHLAPALAVELANQEAKKMSAMVETVMQLTCNWVAQFQSDPTDVERVLKYEGITDNIQAEIVEFMTQVNRLRLTERQSRKVKELVRVAHELEGIADACKRIFLVRPEIRPEWQTALVPLRDELRELASLNLQFYESFFERFTRDQNLEPRTALDEEDRFNAEARDRKAQFLAKSRALPEADESYRTVAALLDVFYALVEIRSHTYNLFEEIEAGA